jgi:hypothetical protein
VKLGTRSQRHLLVALIAAFALVVGACSSDSTSTSTDTTAGAAGASGTVIRVPAEHPTIQEAVDAASPGDLILISPGVYH